MEKVEFLQLMDSIYCGAMLNTCLTFVHELGIFDILFDATEPVSLQFIAERKHLKERYTKELLSALVSARILHQDRDTKCYSIPDTFKQELEQMIGFVPGMKAYLNRADRTMECFPKDGPYGFECDDSLWLDWFHNLRLMSADQHLKNEFIPFFSKTGLIPKLESGITVLDIGCGGASFTTALAKMFPKSRFTGLDLSTKALQLARETVDKYPLENVQLIEGDCHNLTNYILGHFDLIFMYDTQNTGRNLRSYER